MEDESGEIVEKLTVPNLKEYQIEYTCKEDVQQTMECGICMEPFKYPLSLTCGHTFCQECLAKSITNQCGFCRAPITHKIKVLVVHNFQDYMETKCSFCHALLLKKDTEKHLKEDCLHLPVRCHLSSVCETVFLRKDKEEHEKKCVFMTVACPFFCGKQIPRKDAERHAKQCRYSTLLCVCGATVSFEDKKMHLDECIKAREVMTEHILTGKRLKPLDIFQKRPRVEKKEKKEKKLIQRNDKNGTVYQ